MEEQKDPIVKFNLYRAWPIVVAIIALTIYIVRIEARVDDYQGQFSRYKEAKKDETKSIVEKIDKIQTDVNTIATGVANIQGKLESRR